MASSPLAAQLTEAQRVAQLHLGVQTVAAMRALFALLDPTDLDGTFERWLTAALPVLQAQRQTSIQLAAAYVSNFKRLEVGRPVSVQLADPIDIRAATTSLLVTGPYRLKKNVGEGALLTRAMSIAEASSSSAAMRHVLNGGRETIAQTVADDKDALGWARVASGDPCAFCAMLTSRGPVYSEESIDFEAHDHCSCTAEPVYHRDAAWPAGSERYRALWEEADNAPGETLANFRALVEA